jgi:hypothetical protein
MKQESNMTRWMRGGWYPELRAVAADVAAQLPESIRAKYLREREGDRAYDAILVLDLEVTAEEVAQKIIDQYAGKRKGVLS